MLRKLFRLKREPLDQMSVTASPTTRMLTTAFCEEDLELSKVKVKHNSSNNQCKILKIDDVKISDEKINDENIIKIRVDINIHNNLSVYDKIS